jgi:hypothetical protein
MSSKIAFAALVLLSGLPFACSSEPVPVTAKDSIAGARQPQAAVDQEGTIYVTFGANEDVYCCKSVDGGQSFAAPVKVGQLKDLALGKRRGPRIAAGKSGVVISAISHSEGTVVSWRSSDQGESWEGPTNVNDAPLSAQEGLHAMAISPNGDVYCVWLDIRNKSMQIYGARSTDGGTTWSKNRQVYRSPDKSVCECCHPSVTFDRAGNLHVMWRNSVRGYRDMYHTVSTDNGESFAEATKLGGGSWKLDACPMDGGYLAAIDQHTVTTVWRRDSQIFRTDSNQKLEQLLGTGEQPWAVASGQGVYVVWLGKRQGELWLQSPQGPAARKLSSNATDPMLAASINGKDLVVAVWESGRGKDTTLMVQVIEQ